MIALGEVAAHLLLQGRLLFGLHPFCYDLQTQGVGQLYDHAYDRLVLDVLPEAPNEVLVYLDSVGGKTSEVGERGVAGTEVVYGETHPQAPQAVEDRRVACQHLYVDRLRDVQYKAAPLQPGLLQDPFDGIGQLGAGAVTG